MNERITSINGDRLQQVADTAEEIDIHPDVCALLAPLCELPDSSEYDEEVEAVTRAVDKRRREFFAGRTLARAALSRLGFAAEAIARNEDRSPRWPDGIKGSISHTDEQVLVAVTASPDILGIGIDLENEHSVDSELRGLIRADEREASMDDTVLFSAKESVFKAVYPLHGEFLEFADVVVLPGTTADAFIANGRSGLASSEALQHGEGRILLRQQRIITAYWVRN